MCPKYVCSGKPLMVNFLSSSEKKKLHIKRTNFPNFLQDVMRYVSSIPNQFRVYEIPYPKWNHLDYMWGIDADKYVFSEILKDIEDFQQKFLK